ncbi:anti-anti-sigma factor [Streptomyces achromogenes]|uniref:Anti-sigma factor antagonist n=1 Tax=Streptomyces achromogenes TaxID=67255 RepID=A0ABU0PRY0_STRAH|nr:STAS domain-containing protein [Streptomyces achromogenes]MDQ0681115.1 anti-anti-sigma factor [Streptomyces achromogenes]MDQ0828257.1 anti-anti-sigma factor [Streptomyces achromogenes]
MAEQEMAGTGQAAQPTRLTVVSTATDSIRVLTLAGEIDYDTSPPLRQALDASGTRRPRIVVDLSRVTFMDSTGINLFIAAHRSLTQADGWIRLAAPTEAVMRLLQIVGVDAVIDCRETLREALGP